jgi:hypothetical protein
MPRCASCNSWIVFGGHRQGRLRFCNERCYKQGYVPRLAQQLPDELVSRFAWLVYEGSCPRCGGPGPVDVHTSHRVWSAAFHTHPSSHPEICCRACGAKAKWRAILFSGLLGWWGMPWGALVTPVQLYRNVSGLLAAGGDDGGPTPQLEAMVRLDLTMQASRNLEGAPAAAE